MMFSGGINITGIPCGPDGVHRGRSVFLVTGVGEVNEKQQGDYG
tara:strand:- start:589 stop:720 length:132 start_codon:yes stop_codon:yes gene_type:complete